MDDVNEKRFTTTGSFDVEEQIDLEACDRDPIHQTAHIQPHGTFLDVDPSTLEIRSAAENVLQFTPKSVEELIGLSLDEVFDGPVLDPVHEFIDGDTVERSLFLLQGPDRPLAVRVFPMGDRAGLEIEPERPSNVTREEFLRQLNNFLDEFHHLDDRDATYEKSVRVIRSVTGYDRVFLYRFDEDGHGSVVAEERDPSLREYLGLQFPASDIPEPARRLYRKNPFRLITDAEYTPVPVLGPNGPREREELDLTYSTLRSVPAVHRTYMGNMGVRGSLSISLMVEGQLWGLISCHSTEPKIIDWNQRNVCKLIGQLVAQQLGRLQAQERNRRYDFVDEIREELQYGTAWEELKPDLEQAVERILPVMDANGFYLELGERTMWVSSDGLDRTTAETLLPDLREQLKNQEEVRVRSILDEMDPDWTASEQISGVLARRTATSNQSFCVWFRPEHEETIEWGGDPRKPVQVDEEGQLNPRSSFQAWTQVVSGRCRRWEEIDRLTAREVTRIFRELEIALQRTKLQEVNRTLEARNRELREIRNELETTNQKKEQLLQKVKEMARTDDLTGLLNRNAFMDRLDSEMQRSRRYGEDLALALIDLDYFKDVNDRHGHPVGDDVLRFMGELLILRYPSPQNP